MRVESFILVEKLFEIVRDIDTWNVQRGISAQTIFNL